MRIRSRSLVVQVTGAALVVAAVVAAAFVVALLAIGSLRGSASRESQSKDVVAATLEAQTRIDDLETGVRGYVLSGGQESFLAPYREAVRRWPATISRLERLVQGNPKEQTWASNVVKLVSSYESEYADPVIRIARISPSAASGPAASAEGKRRDDAIRNQLGHILDIEAVRSTNRAATAHSVAHDAVVAASVGLAASLALVLLFGAWIARSVARPVLRVSEGAREVAEGHLSTRLDERGAGEIAVLAQSFNAMTRALEEGRRELIAQNEQLRASEQAKSDLISMISHELRTPLSSVLGFTALLLSREVDPDERRRYLEIVNTEARRLAKLAEDFLDVRLLEEGRMEIAPEPVDLAQLVSEQTRLFFAHARNHVVTVDVPDLPLVVPLDRDRIVQVVANLLSNALKYSPGGGRITVTLRRESSLARLSVADDGIGIAPEDRGRIFEKFFRGRAPAAGIPGTGLGLGVSRMIVEAHGGRIGFESEEGIGTTFWVELPLQRAAPVETERPAASGDSAAVS